MIVPTGVRYVSTLPGSGYGDSAEQYISGLRTHGIPVSWVPAGIGNAELPAGTLHADIRNAGTPYDTNVVHLRPQDIDPWIEQPSCCVNVGYVAWETDRAPAFWRETLDSLDLVLVPSVFNQGPVAGTGTRTPVEVVPHIARRVQRAQDGRFGHITERDFVFYTMGPWHNRKAVPETIRAFLETFTADDEVALIIKTSSLDYGAVAMGGESLRENGAQAKSWWSLAKILAGYPRHPKLFLHNNEIPARAIDQIHTRGDCFVSLTRGEGWSLGAFDAALFGNPSIITGWGGQVEYLGHEYPWLVDYRLVPTTFDEPDAYAFPLDDKAHWALADLSHAGDLMRDAYENRQETAEMGLELRERLAGMYSAEVVTSRLLELITAVRNGHPDAVSLARHEQD